MMSKASQLLLTAMVALVAAGVAALAFALLPLLLFVIIVVACTALALAVWRRICRERRQAERKAAADAQAARLAELRREADALKAREQAVETVQLAVIEDFRREYGL
jgi:hypothetical protein